MTMDVSHYLQRIHSAMPGLTALMASQSWAELEVALVEVAADVRMAQQATALLRERREAMDLKRAERELGERMFGSDW